MLSACLPSETNTTRMWIFWSTQHVHPYALTYVTRKPQMLQATSMQDPGSCAQCVTSSCNRQAVCSPRSYHIGSMLQVKLRYRLPRVLGCHKVCSRHMCWSDVCSPYRVFVVCQHLLLRFIMTAHGQILIISKCTNSWWLHAVLGVECWAPNLWLHGWGYLAATFHVQSHDLARSCLISTACLHTEDSGHENIFKV